MIRYFLNHNIESYLYILQGISSKMLLNPTSTQTRSDSSSHNIW